MGSDVLIRRSVILLVRVFAWPFVLRGVNLLALFLKVGFTSKRSRIVQLAKKIAVFWVKSAHARVRRGERIGDDSCYLLCKYCTSDICSTVGHLFSQSSLSNFCPFGQ